MDNVLCKLGGGVSKKIDFLFFNDRKFDYSKNCMQKIVGGKKLKATCKCCSNHFFLQQQVCCVCSKYAYLKILLHDYFLFEFFHYNNSQLEVFSKLILLFFLEYHGCKFCLVNFSFTKMSTFKLKKKILENKLLKVRTLGLHKDFYYNWKVQLGLTPLNSTHHMTPLRWSNLFLLFLLFSLLIVFVFRVQIRALKDFKNRAI